MTDTSDRSGDRRAVTVDSSDTHAKQLPIHLRGVGQLIDADVDTASAPTDRRQRLIAHQGGYHHTLSN